MKGKKTTSENIANVITAKISNPDLSLRDIEKETGVNYKVSGDIINKDLPEVVTSCNKARELFEINLDIINIGAEKVAKAIKTMNPEDIKEAKEMQGMVETAFKQNQLIQGKATEVIEVNGSEILKDIQSGKITSAEAYEVLRMSKE